MPQQRLRCGEISQARDPMHEACLVLVREQHASEETCPFSSQYGVVVFEKKGNVLVYTMPSSEIPSKACMKGEEKRKPTFQ